MGKRNFEIAFANALMGAALLVTCVFIVAVLGWGSDSNPDNTHGPSHNYEIPWLDGTEQHALDTMQSIIPNGEGVIEYGDGTVDSIRWGYNDWYNDEDVMWIGANGDTIWE